MGENLKYLWKSSRAFQVTVVALAVGLVLAIVSQIRVDGTGGAGSGPLSGVRDPVNTAASVLQNAGNPANAVVAAQMKGAADQAAKTTGSLMQRSSRVVDKGVGVADQAVDTAGTAIGAAGKVVDFGAGVVNSLLGSPNGHPTAGQTTGPATAGNQP